MTDAAYPQEQPTSHASEHVYLQFIIAQALLKLAGPTLVQVQAVTNSGGVAPFGFVDVLPLVNQMTADLKPQPHGTVYGLPYLRIQGGANAVILDPQVGDIGMACFASRDISSVKATQAQANPPSTRVFDWADGMYLGGMLNGVPNQYVQFNAQGITVLSPQAIVLTAPNVTINASTQFTVQSRDSEFSGTVHTPGTIFGDTDVIANGHSGATHVHADPQGGNVGPPI